MYIPIQNTPQCARSVDLTPPRPAHSFRFLNSLQCLHFCIIRSTFIHRPCFLAWSTTAYSNPELRCLVRQQQTARRPSSALFFRPPASIHVPVLLYIRSTIITPEIYMHSRLMKVHTTANEHTTLEKNAQTPLLLPLLTRKKVLWG